MNLRFVIYLILVTILTLATISLNYTYLEDENITSISQFNICYNSLEAREGPSGCSSTHMACWSASYSAEGHDYVSCVTCSIVSDRSRDGRY